MDYKNDIHSDDDFDCSNGYGDHNGNNGYGSGQTRVGNPNGLSKAELRKTNKPIMEKRRRARINHCLNELKSLILEAMKKDPARHTKLEKADILEMTVKHLQSVQRQQLNMAIQTDPTVIHKFKTGFVECADEVNRYISQLDTVDAGVRQRLTSHLNNCATSLEQIGSMTNFNNGYRSQLNGSNSNNNTGITTSNLFGNALPSNPLVAAAAAAAVSQVTTPAAIFPPLPQDLNNNSNHGAPIQMGGVQLIPSRLPSGEFALIMPNPTQPTPNGSASILSGTTPLAGNMSTAFTSSWPATGVIGGGSLPPLPAAPIAPTPNDFNINFQRISAFSKPLQKVSNQNISNTVVSTPFTSSHQPLSAGATFHQPQNNLHHSSTATTSPPLSPISSVSSHGDGDSSIMHTSSDFNTTPPRPVTPPHDIQVTAAQQHSFSGVFSTPSSAESSLNQSRSSTTNLQQSQVSSTSGSELNASLKRPLSEACDSIDSSDSSEPLSKKFASAEKFSLPTPVSDEERDSMWRPW